MIQHVMSAVLRASRRLASKAAVPALALSVLAPAVQAQAQIQPPEAFQPLDANGVNLQTGNLLVKSPTISIGPKQGGLTYSAQYDIQAGAWRHGTAGGVTAQSTHIQLLYPYTTVTLMGQSITFMKSSVTGVYMPVDDPSATLALSGSSLLLTLGDGSQALYDQPSDTVRFYSNQGQIGKLTKPSGEIITFTYAFTTVVSGGATVTATRIQSINNNFGYQLHFDYDAADWFRVAKVTALNNAVDACAPSAVTCSYSRTWPSLTFGFVTDTEQNVTDAVGNVTRLFFSGTGYRNLTGIRGPATSSGQDLAVAFDGSAANRVNTITTGAGTWTYAYSDPPADDPAPDQYTLNTYVTEPALPGDTAARTRTIGIVNKLDYYAHRTGRIGTVTDALGNTTTYGYELDYKLLSGIEHPEHDKTNYFYDARGNIVQMNRVSKAGATVATTSATYPTSCASPITPATCNKPTSVTDERGAVTTFTYDATHGGVLTATSPAPSSGALQPQIRTTYAPFTAWYKDATGVITQDARAIYLPTGASACATLGPAVSGAAAPCAGLADEVKTTVAYQAGSASAASNLLPVVTSNGAGDGSLTATQTLTYTAAGDPETVDGPLAGSADTTRTYYNANRQVTGVIGPDPDGSGTLLYRATRTTYEADGQVQSVETGTATSQSDSGLSTFTALQTTLNTYDALRRKAGTSLVVGGVKQTLTQFSYYANNLPRCQAVRMNPGVFDSLTVSACELGATGSDGPDRITYTTYDRANRPIQVTSGYATSAPYAPRVEKTVTYTANGKEASVADGKGNLTTYVYDGLDRLSQVNYPSATCCTSSASDYEAYGYDVAGNRTSWRRRDGTTVAFAYDALNRPQNGLRGEAYSYDLLGRRIGATYSGQTASASFDALGRMLTETTNSKTLSYQYNLAGQRTRMSWWDGAYVQYGYDSAGETTSVVDSGGATLAAYAYDNLGRRASVTRGDGGSVTYGYDAASRLNCLWLNAVCGVTSGTPTWAFVYSAASQVKGRVAATSTYEWSGTQAAKTYAVNGLNQMTTAGAASIAYDLRGNLSGDGTTSYGYDLLNNLTSTSGGAGLVYEPTGRLWQVSAGGTTTSFVYSGSDLVAEMSGETVLRRYVPGPGVDAPIVWYEGSATTSHRYLLADPQGSIVGAVNDAGASLYTNTYDEYGVPAASNQGRFQYTGQIWLPQVGVYHYKARTYSPTLGRFLQTDPIGYKDGLNWYAYTGNDPLNHGDPTGMALMDDGSQGYYVLDGSEGGNGGTSPSSGADLKLFGKQVVTDSGLGNDAHSTLLNAALDIGGSGYFGNVSKAPDGTFFGNMRPDLGNIGNNINFSGKVLWELKSENPFSVMRGLDQVWSASESTLFKYKPSGQAPSFFIGNEFKAMGSYGPISYKFLLSGVITYKYDYDRSRVFKVPSFITAIAPGEASAAEVGGLEGFALP